jgi:hypothetical protein
MKNIEIQIIDYQLNTHYYLFKKMQNTLFNISLFSAKNPWVEAIFSKRFDAYFFLDYPAYQYNAMEVYDPFPMMNNLGEKVIFVHNIDFSLQLEHTLNQNTWNRTPFENEFKSKFQAERFLFWRSENEKWTMFSDEKTKVAIMGINWKLADQVPMFHQNCMLSPKQMSEKLDLGESETAFFERYLPCDILTKGNEENPIWVKYYFQCKVPTENDRLFYWQQFEPLHEAMMKFLADFKTIDMYADQAFWRRYKQRGTIYTTGKNAPVGGWQKYSYDNCKKVATKFLTQNQHLQLQFEGKIDESEALYWANKDGLIEFMLFWIYAKVEKTKIKGRLSDFHFSMGRDYGNKDSEFNQTFQFFYKKSLINEDLIAELLEKLNEIAFVKDTRRIEQPQIFANYKIDEAMKIEGIYGI